MTLLGNFKKYLQKLTNKIGVTMKRKIILFVVLINSLFASSYDKLKEIADLQNVQFEIRKLTFNEHYQSYQLIMESLIANSSNINSSTKHNMLLFYKEPEKRDSK